MEGMIDVDAKKANRDTLTMSRQYLFLLRLTKSAKREAEEWARQTKRTLGDKHQSSQSSSVKQNQASEIFSVMEMIKHRKHSWISRPRRQVYDKLMMVGNPIDCYKVHVLKENLNKIDLKASDPLDSAVVGLGYEEHSGIMEMELDSR